MTPARSAFLAPALLGVGVFLALQLFLSLTWKALFAWQRVEQAWWLDSGKSIVVTLLLTTVVSALLLTRSDDRHAQRGIGLAAGMAAGMVACLLLVGPGNLWPIVVAFGSVLLGGAVLIGAIIAWVLRRFVCRAGA